MRTDRYFKLILTVIAMELLWIGIKDLAVPVSAQATPTRVVIAGVEVGAEAYLPIAVVGNVKTIPAPLRPTIEPLAVRVGSPVQIDTAQRPLKIETDRPLKIEADRPLKVEPVRYTPGDRPGE